MRKTFGYAVRIERRPVACRDGKHGRRLARYWLESRPTFSQGDLFTTT